MRVIRRRIAAILAAGGLDAGGTMPIAGEVVAIALGDAYQLAVLGIADAGQSDAFAAQIDAAVKYGLSRT